MIEATGEAASGHPPASSDQPAIAYSRIPLFRNVEEKRLQAVLTRSERIRLPAGTTLLRPGQKNDCIYIILAGKVVVYLQSGESRGTGIAIPPGQCIGEFSAIDGMPASAFVEVEADACVLRLPQELFWSQLVTLPGVARNMMVSLTERTRLTNRLALEAERERLELEQLRKELHLARQLQASMLPLQGSLFPERSEIEISALMEPASSVGGDFFDAFFVGDDRLFLCIGDVSGHGIGAALLMARTIGLLRILAFTEATPDALLARLNESMVQGNDTCAFATIFCGFLDVGSGHFVYSNGGHCHPLLDDGSATVPLTLPRGVLVGAFPGMAYSSLSLDLTPGDLLFIYTDGITEAESPAGVPFSLSACRSVLEREREAPLPRLLEQLREEVRRFTGSPGLEDDCTLLALRRPRSCS